MQLSSVELSQVLSGCRQGERSAQRRLYDAFYAYGLTICLHYAADRSEAEEILHDAFLRAFRYLDKLDQDAAFPGWFRQILIRQAINRFRSRQRKAAKEREFHQEQLETTVSNEAENLLSKDDALRFLQELPPAYRMVTTLYVLEGYTHREIAAELGIAEGTSKSNYFKARKLLRQMVERFYPATSAS
ncbi:MAG: RNA polymerase sigma factor [Bacteroidota bacterium]